MATILVVDDDEVILKVAKACLQKAGYFVATSSNGHEAIEKASKETFDLIITDANMPGGISGFDLTSTLRKANRNADVPIVFLTGRREKYDIERALKAGANDYIVKPIDPDMFLAKVTSLLDKRPNPYTFKKFPAHSSFEISYHLEVIALGEQGIDLVTPIPLKVDSKMMIDCPLFTKVGIGTAHVRIAATRPNPNDESQFFSTANFIGLSDNALQMIRRWVMKQDTAVKAS